MFRWKIIRRLYNLVTLRRVKDVRRNKNGERETAFRFHLYAISEKRAWNLETAKKDYSTFETNKWRLIHFHRWIVRKITCYSFIFADIATNERILFFPSPHSDLSLLVHVVSVNETGNSTGIFISTGIMGVLSRTTLLLWNGLSLG